MHVRDLLEFNKEDYFNGAVQADWFYDKNKVDKLAASYIFHGPKYFGVSSEDIVLGQHKLVDTVTFTQILTNKLYSVDTSNNFMMTIAGYGTGKSHLTVALAALFSKNDNKICEIVSKNIISVDSKIGEYIKELNTKKNLVLVLNGMNNFNLDYEMLNATKKALHLHNIDESVIADTTKTYSMARHFIEQTFDICKDKFIRFASIHNVQIEGIILKDFLLKNLETDQTAFKVANAVYREINGDDIKWERGISAGDIISLLGCNLCGEKKQFNKVIILFDEFGRYLEYAAANPSMAGESALQQIFEAVQNADGKIIFAGFIQSDLSSYLSRIEKTANIIRYVGRYEVCDKLYLSSNFETILASLIKKRDESRFQDYVVRNIDKYERYHTSILNAISRWSKNGSNKSVWKNERLYKQVILYGCYPLYPLTVWLLSNMTDWMQQRSTIAFAEEMFQNIAQKEINNTWIPYIYPINIIDSNIYNEMLNSEEKGLVQSQYCLLYHDIMLKIGDKLNENEVKVLKAVLVINIAKFMFYDKEDTLLGIRYCSGLKDEEIALAVNSLEEMYGVISFDETGNKFDLITEASGFNEFKRVLGKYKILLKNFEGINSYDEEISSELLLDRSIETSFAQTKNVSSVEWCFARKLIDIKDFNSSFCVNLKRELNAAIDGELPRGMLVYLYCTNENYNLFNSVSAHYKENGLEKYPVLILLVNDSDGDIISAMKIRAAMKSFPSLELKRFEKFIQPLNRSQINIIVKKFNDFLGQRAYFDSLGALSTYEDRLSFLCTKKFVELYSKIPEFVFDGFEKKISTTVKKYLFDICIRLYDKTLTNMQSYQALPMDVKNRIKSVFSTEVEKSWQVFDKNCSLGLPKNKLILEMYNLVNANLASGEIKTVRQLFEQFLLPPYGMNEYSLTLFIMYYLAFRGKEILTFYGEGLLRASQINENIFSTAKSKCNFNELLRIKLQLNNNFDHDSISDLCTEIFNNKNVEMVRDFKLRLDDLIKNQDVTSENETIVARAKSRLDDGERIFNRIYEEICKAENILDEAKKTFVIYKFARVYAYLSPKKGIIEEYSDYEYSEKYNLKLQTLSESSNVIWDSNFKTALAAIKFNLTQLSQAKSLYGKACTILRENNKEDYANQIEEKISSLETELIAKQKYESLILQCEKDISSCADAVTFTFKQCEEYILKMVNWETFFKNKSDIPTQLKAQILSQISCPVNTLEQRKEKILNDYSDFTNVFLKNATYNQLGFIENRIEEFERLGMGTNESEKLNIQKSDLKQCINFCDSLTLNLKILNEKRSNIKSYVNNIFYHIINEKLEECISQISQNQLQWVQLNIDAVKCEIPTMSAQMCLRWKNSTDSLPEYLDGQCIKLYNDIYLKVMQRLKECNIQGVVSLFNELSNDEKRECLKIIQGN